MPASRVAGPAPAYDQGGQAARRFTDGFRADVNAAEPAQCNPVVGDNPDPPIGDDVYMSADACPAGSPGIAGIVAGR